MNDIADKIDLILFVLAGFFVLGYLAQAVFLAGCMASGKVNKGRLAGTNAYIALVLALAGVFFV